MTLNDILDMWSKDSKIDSTDLTRLSQQNSEIPYLHSKYLNILTEEKLKRIQLNKEYLTLKTDKSFFYLNAGTSVKEYQDAGWEIPPTGKVFKTDLEIYFNKDTDMVNLSKKLEIQHLKVELLEYIMKQINNMNWIFRNAIDIKKFNEGSN